MIRQQEKELAINQYLCDTIVYDEDAFASAEEYNYMYVDPEIVVTGYLDGNLSHAWNKVKIDDEWQIVDVTNNDNEYFFNALLNLPSSVGDS